jgi:hypothetical protein
VEEHNAQCVNILTHWLDLSAVFTLRVVVPLQVIFALRAAIGTHTLFATIAVCFFKFEFAIRVPFAPCNIVHRFLIGFAN